VKTFTQIKGLLRKKDKKTALLLLIMIAIMAVLDALGVASVLPFIAVLTNPEIIQDNFVLKNVFDYFGFQNNQNFLFSLGLLSFLLLVFSLFFKGVTTYLQLKFIMLQEFQLSRYLFNGYLHQPYQWHLNRHSADLTKTILSEVGIVTENGMRAMLNLISHSTVSLLLIILIIFIDPILALIVSAVLSLIYFLIYFFSKEYLQQIGDERLEKNKDRYKVVNEAFSSIKEIKIGGHESIFLEKFTEPSKIFANNQAKYKVISQIPRYGIEAVSFGGILLIILIIMYKHENIDQSLPIIALYAFAGYRLIPSLQQIYASLVQLKFIAPSLAKISQEMSKLKFGFIVSNERMIFKKMISLVNASFSYANSEEKNLYEINIQIPRNSIIGIVGASGCGKSTLVDIIAGLHKVSEGYLAVDGQVIDYSNLRSWQNIIGYVPQNIQLFDDTLASNIALGLSEDEVNKDLLEFSINFSDLTDLVNNLPIKEKTIIGEKGTLLSGGQKQRIGIARAIYSQPELLILDESTSALDSLTEKNILNKVKKLKNSMTVIIISHRLETIENCDNLLLMDNGKVIDSGSYNHLIKNNKFFKALAQMEKTDYDS